MSPSATEVAGVDGCRGRWLVVRRTLASADPLAGRRSDAPDGPGHGPSAELVDDLEPLIAEARRGDLAAIAIDMPIALLDSHPRSCDVEARRHLGPRRSSVFPAPVRAVLDAVDYDDARSTSRAAAGVAPSRQAFNLLPAIAHLDPLIDPADQDRIVEAHPELAFARLAGSPLPHPKRTVDGRRLRADLLTEHDPALAGLIESSELPPIDLLDAAALTITAARVLSGDERRLGHRVNSQLGHGFGGQLDHRGRRAEIVW